eukprot:167072-Pelagomonas_calceolata.AAC.1
MEYCDHGDLESVLLQRGIVLGQSTGGRVGMYGSKVEIRPKHQVLEMLRPFPVSLIDMGV